MWEKKSLIWYSFCKICFSFPSDNTFTLGNRKEKECHLWTWCISHSSSRKTESSRKAGLTQAFLKKKGKLYREFDSHKIIWRAGEVNKNNTPTVCSLVWCQVSGSCENHKKSLLINHSCLKHESDGPWANTLRSYKVSCLPFAKLLCLFTFAEGAVISYMSLSLVESTAKFPEIFLKVFWKLLGPEV